MLFNSGLRNHFSFRKTFKSSNSLVHAPALGTLVRRGTK